MTYNLAIGQSLYINARPLDASGVGIQTQLTWTSSNTSVATVTPGNLKPQHDPITQVNEGPYTNPINAKIITCQITAVGAGTCTITATHVATSVTATMTVNVSDGATVASITLSTT